MDEAPFAIEWLHNLSLSTYIRESLYLYPALDVIHVMGVLLLLGSIAVVDFRLLGWVFLDQPISRLSTQILPLSFVGAALGLSSGLLLFISEAEQVWNNPMLLAKFILLLLAAANIVLWHYAEARNRSQWDTVAETPLRAKIAGASSLLLWVGALGLGRLIAFIF